MFTIWLIPHPVLYATVERVEKDQSWGMITIYPSKFDFPSLLRPSAVPENIFKNRKKTEGVGVERPLWPLSFPTYAGRWGSFIHFLLLIRCFTTIRFLYWYFISFLLFEVLLDLYLVFNRYLTDITEWSLATIDCSLPYLLAFF